MTQSKYVRYCAAIPLWLSAFGAILYGQSVSLTLASATATKGSTVTLPLSYTGNAVQAAGVQWQLSYPQNDFSNVTITAGAAASGAGKTVTCNSPAAGQYTCVAVGPTQTAIGNGFV